jgi:Restriction endonuclease
MLTPMLVQYLVGLCCLRRNPSAVNITLGDMVLDPAAGKERDVDITVTLEESPGVIRAFKAYEVKKEKKPLDVADVEQLCIKLLDMTAVTHRAIVSASGFSEAAQAKAARHGVELFAIQPWTRPLEEEFPGFGMTGMPHECLRFGRTLLFWIDAQLKLVAPTGPAAFSVSPDDPITTSTGAPHPRYSTFARYRDELLLRSTELLFALEPATSIARTFPAQPLDGANNVSATPAWPHTHTLDIARDDAHVWVDGSLTKLEMVTINGYLQWQRKDELPQYHVLRRVPDGHPFTGAMVALGNREGEMFGFVVSPDSRVAGVHIIRLEEKHWNVIRKLKLEIPPAQGEP